MLSLLLRNLFFTIIKPGVVVGLIPYLILNQIVVLDFSFTHSFQYLGASLLVIGIIITFSCIWMFAFEGKGTLSPLDPTRELVVTGLYRFSRNPMYIGVLTMLAGEVIFFQSRSLLIYLGIVFILFNLFILVIEEPRLKRDFGAAYLSYSLNVRRWI